MDNYTFLRSYQELQYNVMFDDLVDLGFARIGFCQKDKSSFWNFALTNKSLSQEDVRLVEREMEGVDRIPAIYFENSDSFVPLADLLSENKYSKDYEDSWLFYEGEEINAEGFRHVKKVNNEIELKTFLATFDDCYKEDDPQNPYGTLGDYLGVAEDVWYRHNKTSRVEYFIVYHKDNPVAVSTLTNNEGMGYISNVGSIPEVRGKGFGKIATLHCVNKSIMNGNSVHFLGTEEGTYPDEFYKRIGFKKRFTGICFKKNI